jgi:hypothetical protein
MIERLIIQLNIRQWEPALIRQFIRALERVIWEQDEAAGRHLK